MLRLKKCFPDKLLLNYVGNTLFLYQYLSRLIISKNVPNYLFSKFGGPPYIGGPGQIAPSS
jgi:hypothetical protein